MDQNGKKRLWPEEVFIGRNNIPKDGTCKSGIEPRKSLGGEETINEKGTEETKAERD